MPNQEPKFPEPEPGRPYGRVVVDQGAEYEVLKVTWREGGRSAIHGHCDSQGWVEVQSGRFRETVFRFNGTELEMVAEREVSAPAMLHSPTGTLHELHSLGPDGRTRHRYMPPIPSMRLFDPEKRETVTVGEHAGAWLPAVPETILDITPWD